MKVSEKSTECTVDSGSFLEYINKESQRNFGIALVAVKRNGLELQYASRRLQNNFTIILEAVQQNGLALQYTSKQQRQSNYLPLQAVRKNSLALHFASKRLQSDNEIIEFTRMDKNRLFPNSIFAAINLFYSIIAR